MLGNGLMQTDRSMQADGSDVLLGRFPDAQRPMPFVAAFDCRQGDVAIEGEGSVGRIWPRNNRVQVFDNLPVREEELRLLRVRELERPQQEPRSMKFNGGDGPGHWQQYRNWPG